MGMLSPRVRVSGWLSNNGDVETTVRVICWYSNNGDVEPTGKCNNYVGTQTMGMLSLRVRVKGWLSNNGDVEPTGKGKRLVIKQWGC